MRADEQQTEIATIDFRHLRLSTIAVGLAMATILHLMGLDHERLTFNYGGRDFRLTDVYGNVIHDILA